MSTTRSAKRSAEAAQLQSQNPSPAVTILTPAAAAAASAPAPVEASSMSDSDPSVLLAAGGPAANPAPEGFEAKVEESTSHKAKRVATESAKHVSEAVTQGLESASAAIQQAAHVVAEKTGQAYQDTKAYVSRESQRTSGPNAVTVAQPPYNLAGEPGSITLADKTHNALNKIQFAGERAIDGTIAAVKSAAASTAATVGPVLSSGAAQVKAGAEVAAAKISEAASHGAVQAKSGAQQLGEKAKELGAEAKESAATNLTADNIKAQASELGHSISAATAQGVDAVKRATGQDQASLDKAQISDASHSVEKPEGSLPMERNADEFPNPRSHHTYEGDSRIDRDSTIQPLGHSGMGTDPAAKVTDAPATKVSSETPVDLLTGDSGLQAL